MKQSPFRTNKMIHDIVMSEDIETLTKEFSDDNEETLVEFNDEDDVDIVDKLFIESVLNCKQQVWDFLKGKGYMEPVITTYYPNSFHESSTQEKCVFTDVACPKCKRLTIDIDLEDNMVIKLHHTEGKTKNRFDTRQSLDYPENSNCFCPYCDMFFIWCPNCGCKETKFHSIFEYDPSSTFLALNSSEYEEMKKCPVGADSKLLYAAANSMNRELVWSCFACDKHFITSTI